MAQEFQDRLAFVSRTFSDVLIIGPIAKYADQILDARNAKPTIAALSDIETLRIGGSAIIEDSLPFAPGSFDLIISAGTLDSVNDLPGALIQLRRSLKPDGLLLATLFGSGSLAKLKTAMMQADGDNVRGHIHPQIDLRSAADLMSRTGYALPVADQDSLTVRYSDWRRLVCDLRDTGVGNAMSGSRSYLGKQFLNRLDEEWLRLADADGKISELFYFLQLSGWSPSPDQPKPAQRGSGKISLADALKSKS